MEVNHKKLSANKQTRVSSNHGIPFVDRLKYIIGPGMCDEKGRLVNETTLIVTCCFLRLLANTGAKNQRGGDEVDQNDSRKRKMVD